MMNPNSNPDNLEAKNTTTKPSDGSRFEEVQHVKNSNHLAFEVQSNGSPRIKNSVCRKEEKESDLRASEEMFV